MLGALGGDIVGSVYEWRNIKTTEFELFGPACRFTDDSVLTVAVADSILSRTGYAGNLKKYTRLYPAAGYGGRFLEWAMSDSYQPYGSWGNGSAMRVSPVGFAFDSIKQVLAEAACTAEVTHNHPDAVRGAQAVALTVFLARTGNTKEMIKRELEKRFGYDLDTPLAVIRPDYRFDVSCRGSVPPALRAFLESADYVDAVRKAISIGGDSDTIGCIAGAAAHAFYKRIPSAVTKKIFSILDPRLRRVAKKFLIKYSVSY